MSVAPGDAPLGRRRRILVVDDQEAMRLLLAQYVEQDLGAEATVVGTCEGALRLLEEKSYDVVLLDVLMPGIGGLEILQRMREDSANRTAPVILVTVLGQDSYGEKRVSAERSRELGASAIVAKPVERKALIATIRAQLPR